MGISKEASNLFKFSGLGEKSFLHSQLGALAGIPGVRENRPVSYFEPLIVLLFFRNNAFLILWACFSTSSTRAFTSFIITHYSELGKM